MCPVDTVLPQELNRFPNLDPRLLPFAESYLAWIAATAAPAFVGLVLVVWAGRWVKSGYLAAFALGIFLWFFVDTIQGSANLDLSAGFYGGVEQGAIVLLFVAGVAVFFLADRESMSSDLADRGTSLAVPLLAAVAVGLHGFGEGTAVGFTAALTTATDTISAFGGLAGASAYVMHKALEPMMVGALYVAYSKGRPKPTGGRVRDMLLLTLLFMLPSAVGAVGGYFIDYDATYLFALGTGSSIYVGLRLARSTFLGIGQPTPNQNGKMAAALVVGFILIYVAALLHS